MSYTPTYAVPNSHLISRRTVTISDMQAAIFLGLARKQDNTEIGEAICRALPGVIRCSKTVSNWLPVMGDLIGLKPAEKPTVKNGTKANAPAAVANVKPKRTYRNRRQLRAWAIEYRLVIYINGEWQ